MVFNAPAFLLFKFFHLISTHNLIFTVIAVEGGGGDFLVPSRLLPLILICFAKGLWELVCVWLKMVSQSTSTQQ